MNSTKSAKKYQAIADKHGLKLSETDIMYLRGFISSLVNEEIKKAKHENKTRKK